MDYASKKLPFEAVNYLVTELLGVHVNISHFKHLPAKVNCDCSLYHLTLIYIIKSRTEPCNTIN